jgi:surface protein
MYTTTRGSSGHKAHTFCYFCFCGLKRYFFVVCGGWSFFSLAPSLLQCFKPHLRSIRTCPNGIRVRWQLWNGVSVLVLPLSVATPSVGVILNVRQLEFHRITILTRFIILFCVFVKRYTCTFCCCLWWVGLSFSLWHPLFAVFASASAFNQDVSKWNTGAVTNVYYSKCTLSPLSLSVATPSVLLCFWIFDNSSFIGSQFSHVLLF